MINPLYIYIGLATAVLGGLVANSHDRWENRSRSIKQTGTAVDSQIVQDPTASQGSGVVHLPAGPGAALELVTAVPATPQEPSASTPTAQATGSVSTSTAASPAAPAPAAAPGDQDRALTEISTTQKMLAKAQSVLSMTTRLGDEAAQALQKVAAQALQEVKDRSAAVRKDLAAARDQLYDIQQKITARRSPRVGGNATPELAPAVPATPQEPSALTPTANATGSVPPSTAASPAAPAPAAASGDQDKALTEISMTQQKLAKAQSALTMTTRLRDEAAQALQEVRDSSAAVRKDLAAARDQLDDIQQKITARNTELSTINKRLEAARLREAQEKRKGVASPRKTTPELPATPQEPSALTLTADAPGKVSPSTAASPAAPAPAAASGDQDKALTEISMTQQKLAKAQSALTMTTRLRDEAAQALQEVRDSSAAVRKDLAAARDQLDDIQQKITARNTELSTINKRLEAARLREAQEKRKGVASPRLGGKTTPELATAVPATPQEPSASTPTAEATGSVSPSSAASPAVPAPAAASRAAAAAATPVAVKPGAKAPKTDKRRSNPIGQAGPAGASPQLSASKPLVEPSSDPTPSKAQRLSDSGGSIAVIGPGAPSPASDFELHSGRISRTP